MHNLYSITCFIYYSWNPDLKYISISFFCISVQHKKIEYIYLWHISCLNYSSTFPMTETPLTVFNGQYFPGSTAPQISFLPQSVTWAIDCSFVISTTDTGQFTSPSLQLLLCTSLAELNFLPFFPLQVKFSIHLIIVVARLEWDYFLEEWDLLQDTADLPS